MASAIPGASAYTFSAHSICKGWTEDRTPVSAESYLPGDTVYLYFEIVWADRSEFKAKWSDLPRLYQGTGTAGWAMEYFPLKSFRIQLSSPTEEVVNSFGQRKMGKVSFEADAIASAFLELINVTSTTENGIWHLRWFDGAALVLDEAFMVGQPATQPATKPATTEVTGETTTGRAPVPPATAFLEQHVLWIVVALGIIAVVLAVFGKTRMAKPAGAAKPAQEAPGPTAPTQEIVRPAVKYCIECGEVIPEVAMYCPRCASKQEQ